jgi:hypothetical protein
VKTTSSLNFFKNPGPEVLLILKILKKQELEGSSFLKFNPLSEVIKNKIQELHNTGCFLRFGQHHTPDGKWLSIQGIHISCHSEDL